MYGVHDKNKKKKGGQYMSNELKVLLAMPVLMLIASYFDFILALAVFNSGATWLWLKFDDFCQERRFGSDTHRIVKNR